MIKEFRIPLFDMILCFSDAMDLVSPAIVDHHKRVAYIAFSIAEEMGLPVNEKNNILLAGALHDIGALSLQERLNALEFEMDNPHQHAEVGYQLLKNFESFSDIALLVRYHHFCWNDGNSTDGHQVPLGSHILHAADRVSVLINRHEGILGQAKDICDEIVRNKGNMFKGEIVESFENLAEKECFWLDVISPAATSILAQKFKQASIELNLEGLAKLAKMFCQIIDFRSRFTATHSSGVAACAEALAAFIGFSERECRMIKISGYLHDLGKLAVPPEILEKPGKLTDYELSIIKSHTYYTHNILRSIRDLDVINAWAAFHHERLDGKGYPFHHKGEYISLGARIIAVADVFTAITEDRPYRKGMEDGRAVQILEQMTENGALDPNVVSVLKQHYDEINSIRKASQEEACRNYQEFWQQLG